MPRFKIKIPVYSTVINVIIENHIETVINRYVKKNKWKDEVLVPKGDELDGYAVNTGELSNYYLFYALVGLNINTVSHEISHLIDHILDDRDIEDTEARAYLTGFISETIINYLLKKDLLVNKWLNQSSENQERKKTGTQTENQSQPA